MKQNPEETQWHILWTESREWCGINDFQVADADNAADAWSDTLCGGAGKFAGFGKLSTRSWSLQPADVNVATLRCTKKETIFTLS